MDTRDTPRGPVGERGQTGQRRSRVRRLQTPPPPLALASSPGSAIAPAQASTLASPPSASTTGAGPAASQRAQLQRSAQCLRSRFVRTPASCVQHKQKKARRTRQQHPAVGSGSDASPPSPGQAGHVANAHKRATPPLPPPKPPPAVTPNVAQHRASLSPTIAASSPASTPTPAAAGLAPGAGSAHLFVLAAVVLIGGGYLVYSLAPKYKRTAAPKESRRSRANAIKHIRQAQEAAATDDAPGAGSTASSAGATKGAPAAARGGPLTLVTAGLPSSGGAVFSELLPSPACVASTSAAIRNGLERIGSAVGAATAGARARARSVSSSTKGKERAVDDGEDDHVPPSSRPALPSAGLAVPSAPAVESLTRRAKGRKGFKSALSSPVGSSTSLASPSTKASRSPARQAVVREVGVNSDKTSTAESAVQTVEADQDDVLHIARRRPRAREEDADQTPPHHTPAQPSDPPRLATAEASVQTSPRLLLLASPTPSASTGSAPEPLLAPNARPSVLPLPFDLHASFQSTPVDPPQPPHSLPSSAESNGSSYPTPTSPPLSPLSRSRSPTNSSTQRSSSASASVSASPTSPRAVSPVPSGSRRESATSSVNGHLAVDATPSRPRNARRRSTAANAAAVAAAADEASPRGVVGLPGAVAAPRKGKGDDRGAAKAKTKDKERGKEREREWEKEKDEEREREVLRRPSTASSSGASGKGSSGLTMSRDAKRRGQDQERDRVREEEVAGASDLRGLGVEMDDAASRGDTSLEGSYPFPHVGGVNGTSGVHTPGWTPESSPHPTQRTLSSSSSYGAALVTPTAQRPPWSPQLMAQQYTMIPPPASATRPPSRGSSLSVPPTMGPLTPLQGPTTAQLLQHEAQQMQAAQQQQQQAAYALAHAHAQAQVQAQYQHVVTMQLQVQQHHQQQQHQLAQQRQQHQQLQRRRSTMPNAGDEYDGFLSPIAASVSAYPLSSVASPPLGSTGAAPSPLLSSFAAQHQQGGYGMSQGPSPTTGSFPSSAHAAHAAAAAAAASMYPYASSPSPAGTYLASPAATSSMAGSPYAHAHASPTQAHFQQSQLSRSTGSSSRPRLQSSVSAIAALGGSVKGGGTGASGSPGAVNGLSHSLGPGGKSSRSGDKTQRSSGAPASPAGHGSSGSSAPISGGVQLGDPPGGPKNRLKQAEMDADRTAKELEIARWKLIVLEDERKAAEVEHQEALRALATRAMRAEARIKLIEEAAKTQQSSSPVEPPSSTPASSAAPSASNSPVVHSATLPVAGLTPIFPDYGGTSSPGSSVHPLSWLDLDAVSFQGPRPFAPPRSPSLLSSPSGGNQKWRNKRNSSGGSGGRRPSSGQRRKSSTSPTAAPVPPPELIDTDDEEVLIVLDAPMRRRSVNPRQQTPSRRSSYAPDDEHDGPSFIDDDEIPTIDVDESEPIAGGAVMGESEDGTRQHPEYIGFLPSRLSPRRAFGIAADSPAFGAEDDNAPALSVPSFTLDASPEPDVLLASGLTGSMDSPSPLMAGVDDAFDDVSTKVVIQTSGLPSASSEQSLSPVPPTSPDEHTPRMPGPPSPATSPRRTTSSPSCSPRSRRPEDTPLPPSPLAGAIA